MSYEDFMPGHEESNETKEEKKEEIQIINKPISHQIQTINQPIEPKTWFKTLNWTGNPFIFNIIPGLSVGYDAQKHAVLNALEEKHKLILVTGPTGSGKTTFLRWLTGHLPRGFDYIYIGKPPAKPDDFLFIFKEKYRESRLRRLINPMKSLYQLPNYIKSRVKNHLVIFFDEAHESDVEVLSWLRFLSDNEKISVVIAGLPVLEDHLRDNLETLRMRISKRIELLSLTKEETTELIKKRIVSIGGSGEEMNNVIDIIYNQTGGFPREVIRLCDEAINKAMNLGITKISRELFEEKVAAVQKEISFNVLDTLTPMQKQIIEIMKKPMTPGEVADILNLEKYKSRQHAVRSVNNVLKVLLADGLVERKKTERAFLYELSPKIKTLVIKA